MTAAAGTTDEWGDEATTYDLLGGDTYRFDEQGPLVASYAGFDLRDTQYGDDRVLHHFIDDEGKVWDVWGATGLDNLLASHVEHEVRVIRTEDMLTTSHGRKIRIWKVSCRNHP